ncbi:MAG TPA: hypothetical protein VF902_04215 [Coriobacteriia bacterium]
MIRGGLQRPENGENMACLEPGRTVEETRLVLPVRFEEVTEALEDIVPRLVNSTHGVGSCRAVAAIIDRFESCAFEETLLPSLPEVGGPIRPLEGAEGNEAFLDSWVAKGTLLGEDGVYTVFVVFIEVMRRPLQGSWTAHAFTVLGTLQSVGSLIEELKSETQAGPVPRVREAPEDD